MFACPYPTDPNFVNLKTAFCFDQILIDVTTTMSCNDFLKRSFIYEWHQF